MGASTAIAWTDATWNCWQGCHKVSAGCKNCYMFTDKKRYGQTPDVVIRSAAATFNAPLKWAKNREKYGHINRVFVDSWSDFFIEEADAWRAVNAPPKVGKSVAGLGETAEKQRASSLLSPQILKKRERSRLIDVKSFIETGEDFDQLMIGHAENVPQVAYGLYLLACQEGAPGEISAATKNWHEAAKAGAAIRTEFLDLQERTRALIQLDIVLDIIGTELQAVRAALLKLGERCANDANPQDPGKARTVIDAAVDRIFTQMSSIAERVQKETAP